MSSTPVLHQNVFGLVVHFDCRFVIMPAFAKVLIEKWTLDVVYREALPPNNHAVPLDYVQNDALWVSNFNLSPGQLVYFFNCYQVHVNTLAMKIMTLFLKLKTNDVREILAKNMNITVNTCAKWINHALKWFMEHLYDVSTYMMHANT